MEHDVHLYVQVILKNGRTIEGNLMASIPKQKQLLISEDSILFMENKEGVIIYTGPSDALFIEKDMIHSISSTN